MKGKKLFQASMKVLLNHLKLMYVIKGFKSNFRNLNFFKSLFVNKFYLRKYAHIKMNLMLRNFNIKNYLMQKKF